MTFDTLPYLSQARLEALAIPARDVVASIEHLLRGQRQGTVWAAPKSTLYPPDGRYFMATLAAADDPPFLSVKCLVLNLANSARGLPDLNSLVVVLDSETGVPVGLVDGNWVTAVRTAGLSAVAALRLARRDSASLALIGCGVQAHSHLQAFAALFPLRRVHAFGRGEANRLMVLRAAEALGLEAIASPTAQAAMEAADIVISTVSTSPTTPPPPFLDARWLRPGGFACLVDLAGPWFADGFTGLDRIFIDDLAQEQGIARKLIEPRLVAGDLAGLVCGDVPGRTGAGQRTCFAFRGMALGDLAVAGLALQRARAGVLEEKEVLF